MKKSDSCEEIVETWTGCPHCFKNVKLDSNMHHIEDDVVTCPECGEEFQLGEVQ